MSAPSSSRGPLDSFRGEAPLIPLPNLVLFPHALQTLHVFEPRYRQLVADALERDRLIAIALLKPGWEETSNERPPIFSMACLGRIRLAKRLPGGRYELLVQGLRRARVIREQPPEQLYRMAKLELPRSPVADANLTEVAHRARIGLLRHLVAGLPEVEQYQRLLDSSRSLGAICDALAFALRLPPLVAQELLEEIDAQRRFERLVRQLREQAGDSSPPENFPPRFSEN